MPHDRDRVRQHQMFAASETGRSAGDKQGKRAKVEERLELMLMWKLSEEMDLDEKTGAKFFPIVKKHERERKEILHRLKKTKKGLRQALKEEQDEKLAGLLADLKENTKKLTSLKDQEHDALKGVLSTRQLTQYILFRERFGRKIRDIVADTRQRRKRNKGPDHRPPIYDEDEDN